MDLSLLWNQPHTHTHTHTQTNIRELSISAVITVKKELCSIFQQRVDGFFSLALFKVILGNWLDPSNSLPPLLCLSYVCVSFLFIFQLLFNPLPSSFSPAASVVSYFMSLQSSHPCLSLCGSFKSTLASCSLSFPLYYASLIFPHSLCCFHLSAELPISV